MQLHFKCFKIIILFFAFANAGYAQQSVTNPLLIHSNDSVRFDKVTVAVIHEAAISVIKQTDAMIKKITAIPANSRTYSNTLKAYDELLYNINDVNAKICLIAAVYFNDSLRNAAEDDKNKITTYIINLNLNEYLYKAIKQFAATEQTKQLHPNQQKFLRETVFSFEKNGMKLDTAHRKQLAIINEKINDYSFLFKKNIAAFDYKEEGEDS